MENARDLIYRQWKLHQAFFVPTYNILVNGEFERILPTKPGS